MVLSSSHKRMGRAVGFNAWPGRAISQVYLGQSLWECYRSVMDIKFANMYQYYEERGVS